MDITPKQAEFIKKILEKTVTAENAKSAIQRFCCVLTTDFPKLAEMVSIDTAVETQQEFYAYNTSELDKYLARSTVCPSTRGILQQETRQSCRNLFGLVVAIIEAAGHLEKCIAADTDFNAYAKTSDFKMALSEGKSCLVQLLQLDKAMDLRARMEQLKISNLCTNGQIRLLESVLGLQVGPCSLENCPRDLPDAGAEVKERADGSKRYTFCFVQALPIAKEELDSGKIYFAKKSFGLEGTVLSYCVLKNDDQLCTDNITLPFISNDIKEFGALLELHGLEVLTKISQQGHIYSEEMAAIFNNVPGITTAAGDAERKSKFEEFAALVQQGGAGAGDPQPLLLKFSSLQRQQEDAYSKLRLRAGKDSMSWGDVDLTTFELRLMMQNAEKNARARARARG